MQDGTDTTLSLTSVCSTEIASKLAASTHPAQRTRELRYVVCTKTLCIAIPVIQCAQRFACIFYHTWASLSASRYGSAVTEQAAASAIRGSVVLCDVGCPQQTSVCQHNNAGELDADTCSMHSCKMGLW